MLRIRIIVRRLVRYFFKICFICFIIIIVLFCLDWLNCMRKKFLKEVWYSMIKKVKSIVSRILIRILELELRFCLRICKGVLISWLKFDFSDFFMLKVFRLIYCFIKVMICFKLLCSFCLMVGILLIIVVNCIENNMSSLMSGRRVIIMDKIIVSGM